MPSINFPDDVIQYTAVAWLKEFVSLSGRAMLPFASGIITSVLPCLSYDDENRKSNLGKLHKISVMVFSFL